MASVAKYVELYRAQYNAEIARQKDEAEREDETCLPVEEDDATEEHVVKAVSEETPKVVEEHSLTDEKKIVSAEESPKTSTTVTNKVTRAALLRCALLLCMVMIAYLVYDTMQFKERITRAMAKTPPKTTTGLTLPIHLRREEANVRPPVPTTKFDVAAEALSVAKQCSIGWIPGMYDEIYLWGWPWFPLKRCVGSAMGGAGKAVKRVFY